MLRIAVVVVGYLRRRGKIRQTYADYVADK